MQTFDKAMLNKDRNLSIRVGKYQSTQIKEVEFNYGYIAGDTFKPGGTCSGTASITFTSIIETFQRQEKLTPEIGLMVGDNHEWIKMGMWYINDIIIDRNRNSTKLELIDGMFHLNQPYQSDLTYPAQVRDVILEIATKTGVTLQTDNFGLRAISYHVNEKPKKEDITFREVLSDVIQLLGFSAFFNKEGKLEIRGLTDSKITITAENYFLHGLTKSELEYQIAGISCKTATDTLTVGMRTGRSLELENHLMTQNVLNDLYHDIKDIHYYPFSLRYQGHLKLDVGQWITLKTNKQETYRLPVLNQTFTFKGGLSSTISADTTARNDTQYSYGGFLTKKINQMSTAIEAEMQQSLEHISNEFKRVFGDTEKHIETIEKQIEASDSNAVKAIEAFEKKLKTFKDDIIHEGLPPHVLETALTDAGFDKETIAQLKKKALANSDTLETVVDLLGSDGRTTYNRNRATITHGDIPLGTESLSVGHNGDGFEIGKPYVISWEAVCHPHSSSDVPFTLNAHHLLPVSVFLRPRNTLYPTVEKTLHGASETIYAVYHDTYTVTATSDWYHTIAGRTVTIADSEPVVLSLLFKEIADGNLENKYIGEWSNSPEIILHGGTR